MMTEQYNDQEDIKPHQFSTHAPGSTSQNPMPMSHHAPSNGYALYAPHPFMRSPINIQSKEAPLAESYPSYYPFYPSMHPPPSYHLNYAPSSRVTGRNSPTQPGSSTHSQESYLYHHPPPYHQAVMNHSHQYPPPIGKSHWGSGHHPSAAQQGTSVNEGENSLAWGSPSHSPYNTQNNSCGGDGTSESSNLKTEEQSSVPEESHSPMLEIVCLKKESTESFSSKDPSFDNNKVPSPQAGQHYTLRPHDYSQQNSSQYQYYSYGNPPQNYSISEESNEAPSQPTHFPSASYSSHHYALPHIPYRHPPTQHPYQISNDSNPHHVRLPYPSHPDKKVPSPWKNSDTHDKKRYRSSPSLELEYGVNPANKRFYPYPGTFTTGATNPKGNFAYSMKLLSESQIATSKSVRRKKKMYSDYVGVTYNKTHAKYQACITHYRKQHYLGRYKLAVDAALAYDESARLLKGASWKVNFATKLQYEEAKIRELESLGSIGGRSVDLEKSLAAVASKVEEIASKANAPAGKNLVVRQPIYPSYGPAVFYAPPQGQHTNCSVFSVEDTSAKSKQTPFPAISHIASDSPVIPKVTPSPPNQESESPHQEKLQPVEDKEIKTPLPESPNPTRHVMGIDTNTPDSVIRPTVLTYNIKESHLVEFQPDNVKYSKPEIKDVKEVTVLDQDTKSTHQSNTESRPTCPVFNSASKIPTSPKPKLSHRAALTSPRPAPVIQNGTLAAASALMTLFGNEKSSADEAN